ncbi:OmpA/MotB family protein [Nocardioides stalactiti]|uniref:OmpA/MotB family protein n=1 Tax=Nocardioides stalactiti TaxID=2755356 RepID=UPI00160200AD|nr:flagellar motor protein MotB [Nocardioides stalactiti]
MSSSHGRRRGGGHEEGHEEGSERWLVTYADMVTLLMVLFIVMFAMSTVDERKYEELRAGLADGFGAKSVLTGAAPTISDTGAAPPMNPSYEQVLSELSEAEKDAVEQMLSDQKRKENERAFADAENEVDRLLDVWLRIDRALRREGLRGDVQANIDERGLVVSLVSRHIVFQPNIAELTPRGQRLVDTIAPVLRELTEPIQVDGHTNQVPVKPKYYPTDWDLSVARAVYVLRRLEEVNRIPEARLRATGFGHTKPLMPPDQKGSQQLNKRVDLVVLSQAPAGTRAKFEEAYGETVSHRTDARTSEEEIS